MRSREYDDDDGRVIADMTGIDDRPVVSRWLGLPDGERKRSERPRVSPPGQAQSEMDPEERRFFIFGAMKASLMIGMVYVIIFAVVIGILVIIW